MSLTANKALRALPPVGINPAYLKAAQADLNTALQTIKHCGIKLYATDAAMQFCQQAEMLIEETGYHLRDSALAALKQHIKDA